MNGGFPPLRNIDNHKDIKHATKDRFFSATINKNLDIKQIFASNVEKPMIDLGKKEVTIISSL